MSTSAKPLILFLCVLAACQATPLSASEDAVERARAIAGFQPFQIQATSCLGGALTFRPPSATSQLDHSAELDLALAELGEDRSAWVWSGRRLAYLGRYRASVGLYTVGLEVFVDDDVLLRHRGHRFITLRMFAAAEADLARAWELVAEEPDTIEPDGLPNESGIPRSTLKTNVLYHLALARYLQGNFRGAAEAWEHCLAISPNDDMRVAAAYWLANSLRRDGRADDAARALTFVRPQMDVLENGSYHRLLLHFRGELKAAGVRGDVEEGTVASPTVEYGLAQQLLHEGDEEAARRALSRVTDGELWPAFGFIAAEADLAGR